MHYSTQRSPFETCFEHFTKSPLEFTIGKYLVMDGHNDVDKAMNFIKKIQLVHQVLQE